MPDYLLTADWKKVIGSSPPPEAAPLTKQLEKDARLDGNDDAEDKVVALQEITELALSLKRKLSKDGKVVAHLDKMAKEAQDTKKKVEAEAAKEEAEAAKSGKDLVLVKMLAKARMLKAEKPFYFALAMGSMSGLVIAKMLSGSHKEKAKEARTRNNGKKVAGKLLLGRCYGESGKVVLELGLKPEQSIKPPAGLAANLKKTIKKQTQGASTIKVIMRGGGQDLDEEVDKEELDDFGPGSEDEDDDEDTPETEQEEGTKTGETDTQVAAEYARRLAALEIRMRNAFSEQRGGSRMQSVFELAEKRAQAGNHAGGLNALGNLEKLLDAADNAAPRPTDLETFKLRLNVKERYDQVKDLPAGAGVKAAFLEAVKAVATGKPDVAAEALDALEVRLTTAERTAGVAAEINDGSSEGVVAYRTALLNWQKCRSSVRDSVEKLITTVLEDDETKALDQEDRDEIAAAIPSLRDDIADFDDKLDNAVNAYINAPTAQKPRAMKGIQKAINAYRAALAKPVLIAMAESGYGDYPIVDEIETALKEFEKLLVR